MPPSGTSRVGCPRSIWNMSFILGALVLGPLFFSWSALRRCSWLSGFTLCVGHSVGFHRRLIHRSFECPKWLERVMIYVGVLVGMGGPLWTVGLHDIRDWAQRQPDCHWFLRHGKPALADGFYYLNFRLVFDHPPHFDPGPRHQRRPVLPVPAAHVDAAPDSRRGRPLLARRLVVGGLGRGRAASPRASRCTGTSPTSRTAGRRTGSSARFESRLGQAHRAGGGEEDQSPFQPRLELRPIRVPRHVGDLGIVHPGPLQRLVAPGEAAGLDHVDAARRGRRRGA